MNEKLTKTQKLGLTIFAVGVGVVVVGTLYLEKNYYHDVMMDLAKQADRLTDHVIETYKK